MTHLSLVFIPLLVFSAWISFVNEAEAAPMSPATSGAPALVRLRSLSKSPRIPSTSMITRSGTQLGTRSIASSPSANRSPSANSSQLPDEVSIKEDRKEVEELRKGIPEKQKRSNDELAALLALLPESEQQPSEFRSRFSTLVSQKRDAMDQLMREKRDTYSNQERTNREAALKVMADAREKYLKDKHGSEDRAQFFDRQEDQRRAYFAKQDEKRKDFESKMQDERKKFDDYIRERTSRFEDIYRDYIARYYERKKNLDLKKQMDEKAAQKAEQSASPNVRGTTILDDGQNSRATAPMDESRNHVGSAIPKGRTPEEEAMLQEFRAVSKLPSTPLAPHDSN